MSRIVVGIDGSKAASTALHAAIEEATWREAEVVAVMVVAVPAIASFDFDGEQVALLTEFGEKLASAEIDRARDRYGEDFPVPVGLQVRIGHAGEELIEEARASDSGGDRAAMLVLGSRGFGGFRGLLLGSVGTYVIHHPPCPVLIVRPTRVDLDADDDEREAEQVPA